MQKLICFLHVVVNAMRIGATQLEGHIVAGHIVGGEIANISLQPHAVFIEVNCVHNGRTFGWLCGASIITQKILLTAAHCLHECDRRARIVARVGNANRNVGHRHVIGGFVLHEGYDPMRSTHDIGMLRTENAIEFGDKVCRAAILKKPPYSENAKVTGWGLIDENKNVTSIQLKALGQKVWRYEDCVRTLNRIPDGTFCAAAESLTEFPARGDSGSALMVRGYIQIGIVSFKIPSQANHLIIYTDVGYHYKWIKVNSRYLYCA